MTLDFHVVIGKDRHGLMYVDPKRMEYVPTFEPEYLIGHPDSATHVRDMMASKYPSAEWRIEKAVLHIEVAPVAAD